MSTPNFDSADTGQLLGFTARMLDSLDRIVNTEPIPEFVENPEELARDQAERVYRYTRGLRDRVDAMRATSLSSRLAPASGIGFGVAALVILGLVFWASERS